MFVKLQQKLESEKDARHSMEIAIERADAERKKLLGAVSTAESDLKKAEEVQTELTTHLAESKLQLQHTEKLLATANEQVKTLEDVQVQLRVVLVTKRTTLYFQLQQLYIFKHL